MFSSGHFQGATRRRSRRLSKECFVDNYQFTHIAWGIQDRPTSLRARRGRRPGLAVQTDSFLLFLFIRQLRNKVQFRTSTVQIARALLQKGNNSRDSSSRFDCNF
jgi:hypothetical protein